MFLLPQKLYTYVPLRIINAELICEDLTKGNRLYKHSKVEGKIEKVPLHMNIILCEYKV